MVILNIAAGKFNPLALPHDSVLVPELVLNVDSSYFENTLTPSDCEDFIKTWELDPDRTSRVLHLKCDIFEFMERCHVKFDRVAIYRFLEHVSFTQVEYFIYLVSTVLKVKGLVDVIVPDYKILADMLVNEDWYATIPEFRFDPHNILLTTELLNEPSCPHASIWTQSRMTKFWEREGRFLVKDQESGFNFDGRGIYLRSIIQRI